MEERRGPEQKKMGTNESGIWYEAGKHMEQARDTESGTKIRILGG